MPDLFDPITVGEWELPQRFVMAPLTRNRAGEGMVPTDLGVTYYAQRAGAGLIVTEGTQPSAVGQGYLNTPGIHTPEQVAAWRRVTDAVHERGGRIVVQLMHAGRIAHPDNKGGLESIAPSALAADGRMITAEGAVTMPVPRALGTDEIPGVVEDFVHAARSAIDAGFDGVEVHAANGYLVHQFLAPGSNVREDEYGGSPENRARFAIEVTTAVAEAIGSSRVGIRVSPAHNIQGATEDDPADVSATYTALFDAVEPLGLAYVSVLSKAGADAPIVHEIRERTSGALILNTGFGEVTTREAAQAILDGSPADAVAVGREFLANPDLAKRWRIGADVNAADPDTFYGGGAEGYTDYPALSA